MPHPNIFDIHAYVKKLKAVGFTEEQAEVQTEAIAELKDEKLAKKQDLREFEMRMTICLGAIQAVTIKM